MAVPPPKPAPKKGVAPSIGTAAYLKRLEKLRKSKVIAYVVSDVAFRVGPSTFNPYQMQPEHAHQMIKLLEDVGHHKRISLYLYSRGGDVTVPWPMLNALRSRCDELEILIPYRAHSAATMLAMGGDNILMGRWGELSPIDPTLTLTAADPNNPERITQRAIAVEDITAYLKVVSEQLGIKTAPEVMESFALMANDVGPLILGGIARQQTYIRMVAGRILASRNKAGAATVNKRIVDNFVTKAAYHRHSIFRDEARKHYGLGAIHAPSQEEEEVLWAAYRGYETGGMLGNAIIAEQVFPATDGGDDHVPLRPISGVVLQTTSNRIRSTDSFVVERMRKPISQLNLTVNMTLPPGITTGLDPEKAAEIQELVQRAADAEIRRQAPVVGYTFKLARSEWIAD